MSEYLSELESSPTALATTSIAHTADGSLTLYSDRYQQSYASHKGAYNEAIHVFVEGTGVAARLAAQKPTDILEVGLGTGLNFLLTAECARKHQTTLHYTALEHTLLAADTFASLHYDSYCHADLWHAWLEWRTTLASEASTNQPKQGAYVFTFETVQLTVNLGNALQQKLGTGFHAVYMDAFSPEVNAELWDSSFLKHLYDCLEPAGILGTYCVKGAVRRNLMHLGFDVEKYAGPLGGKREVLRAHKKIS